MLTSLSSGQELHALNHGWLACLPKGSRAEDSGSSCVRRPGELRSLTLLNTDLKILASVVARSLRRTLMRGAHVVQRGFVPWRQLVRNVLEIDSFARLLAMQSNPDDLATMVFFDIVAAFPSVHRPFMEVVLARVGAPSPLQALLRGLYCDNAMWLPGAPSRQLWRSTAGVAQGCPLSGLLFVLTTDCITRALHSTLTAQRTGMVRACADDLALVTANTAPLGEFAAVLRRADAAVHLALHPSKCVAICLSPSPSEAKVHTLRTALTNADPSWNDMQIQNSGKYLGFLLGPAAGLSSWDAPLAKWRERAEQLARSEAPAGVLAAQYASRCTSCLE